MLVHMNNMKSLSVVLAVMLFALFAHSQEPLGPSEEGTDQPLMWEAVRKTDGPGWSIETKKLVQQFGTHMLLGTNDMKQFCPNYNSLSVPQKVHFWAFLVSAVTRYECYYNPAVRYVEPNMGNDPITGQPIASEGLLQLSYQDVLRHPYCNEFDWNLDKNLDVLDPKKTIFDPIKNLRCGIQILNTQIKKHNLIGTDTGGYWAVLIPKNKHTKIPKIIGHIKDGVKFCGL